MNENFIPRWIIGTIVTVVVGLVVLFNLPFVRVESTERGIVYTWGAVQDKVLTE